MFQVPQTSLRPDGTLQTQPAPLFSGVQQRRTPAGATPFELLKEMFAATPLGLIIQAFREPR